MVRTVVRIFVAVLVLAGCGTANTSINQAPPSGTQQPLIWPTPGAVAPGQDGVYETGWGATQDVHIYDLTGIVQGAPGNISNYSMRGSFSGYGNGYASGYVSGGTDGKGIIKFYITSVRVMNPYADHGLPDEGYEPLAATGEVRIVKLVDSAGSVLAAGEEVTLRCRVDRDFMPAVGIGERPAVEGITPEFDYCRVISAIKGGTIITSTVPVSPTLGR
jgi:hypothetical protein